MHKINVLMSTYNGQKYLLEQLDSIIKQDNCEVEITVRDDGSSDGTLDILRMFSKSNANLIYYEGENKRTAKSFIDLIDHSDESEYYAFADQDDVWLKEKLSKAVSILEMDNKNLPILYCSNLVPVDENLNILKNKLLHKRMYLEYEDLLVQPSQIFGCTMVFNKKLRDIIVDADSPEKFLMHDLWVALVATGCGGKIILDDNAYILYRQHKDSQIGANISVKQRWNYRLHRIFSVERCSIADQAQSMIDCYGDKILREQGTYEYTKLVSEYRDSLFQKVKYLFLCNKKCRTFKQNVFHVGLVLCNKA